MDHDYPTIRRALFDPDCRRGGTVLVHKQPDNIWRIDYQLGDDEDEAAAIQEDTVRASVQAVLDDIGHKGDWELEWWSIYSANTLALDDYRDGRVFFIGDSAHIVPIFGVRGLNNGLADAENIAWKLGMVQNGEASEDLLDSYTPERRGATLDVFANASKSARFMTPPTKGWELMRDAALNLALREPFAGNLANPRQMTPYTYADSPVVMVDDTGFATGPVPGSALPNARHGEGFLSDYLGPDFTLILCDPQLEKSSQRVKTLVLDPNCDAARMLGLSEHSAYLIRPDGHISARLSHATAETIEAAIKHSIQGAA
jgi:3-(3-hydroxy-phenyl)propionate hydroxylase